MSSIEQCERMTDEGQCTRPAVETVEDDGDYCAEHAAQARAELGE